MRVHATTSISVAKLKASLSAYLARVKAGQTILVTEQGRLIARLDPVAPAVADSDPHLAALELAGLIRRGSGGLAAALSELELPVDAEGLSLAGMLEEREPGR